MVISNPADRAAHERMVAISGLDSEVLDRCYWQHRHNYDLGMQGPTFWQKVASDAGISFTPQQIDDLIEADVLMWTSLNEDMLAWVVALQNAGIRTAILSNMVWEIMNYMRQEFGWLSHFQHHTWSCELGIAKPDPAIYIHTCEKLDVSPAEALFIDDKIENVAAARELGIHAIQFSSIHQLRQELVNSALFKGLPVPGAVELSLNPDR
jgi:putative hydrolase of the HAD superfamily